MLLLYAIFALVIQSAFTEKHKYKFKYRLGKYKVKDDVILVKYESKISNHITPQLPYPYREPESCRDVSKACAYYKQDGWCALRDWKVNPRRTYHVMNSCAKTCGFCKEEIVPDGYCVDLFQSCQQHKADGLCNATDTFVRDTMELNCEKTCGFCSELSNELPVARPHPRRELTEIHLTKELCIDLNEECRIYKNDGWCNATKISRFSYMMSECRASCGLCLQPNGLESNEVRLAFMSSEEREEAFRNAKMASRRAHHTDNK
ncbi:hypothetical protein GCK32_011415 [Trichostrongylus colubriformis]|uniref:ShKT domain-containing protein n=1 Tax=Trichostrongylus colubriformis TaxID=6319 RepID=A0AAN8F6U3_TRICO